MLLVSSILFVSDSYLLAVQSKLFALSFTFIGTGKWQLVHIDDVVFMGGNHRQIRIGQVFYANVIVNFFIQWFVQNLSVVSSQESALNASLITFILFRHVVNC